MLSRFHYILVVLIMWSVYLMYLIGYYTVQQFQTATFMESMEMANLRITKNNKEKEFLSQYIRTKAYQSQVAKAMHNKKLPWEETINIIKQEEVEWNKDRDTAVVIAQAKAKRDDPTKNMTNPEKWIYLIRKGI